MIAKTAIRHLRALRDDERATIFVEFALSLPILMTLSFTALETANFAVSNMRISQITMTVADNLSRARQGVTGTIPFLREADINDAILGATIQAGELPLLENGRIVVSSLQRNGAGKQTIRWQRCKGTLTGAQSRYGVQGDTEGTTPDFEGMGSPELIQAPPNSAIIFAEVTYVYKPLVGNWLIGDKIIRREAAFFVRDDRDLTGVQAIGDQSACNVFDASF